MVEHIVRKNIGITLKAEKIHFHAMQLLYLVSSWMNVSFTSVQCQKNANSANKKTVRYIYIGTETALKKRTKTILFLLFSHFNRANS